MLDAMRRGAVNWLAKGLLGLLIIAFAVWGVGDYVAQGRAHGARAKIGDTEITADEYRQAYQDEMNAISRRLGRRLTPEQAKLLGIEQRALVAPGRRGGDRQACPRAAPGPVRRRHRRDHQARAGFQGADGKFSPVAFQSFLRQNGTRRPASCATGARRRCATRSPTPCSPASCRPQSVHRSAAPVSRGDARHRLPRARLRQADQARRRSTRPSCGSTTSRTSASS